MTKDVIEVLAILIGGGGLIGGIVALIKVRPESARISVDAAQGAVVVQASVITSLREENDRLKKEKEACDLEMDALQKIIETIEERKSLRRLEDESLNGKKP